MNATMTAEHPIASRQEWLTARKTLLDRERALTHAMDEVRAERRKLPWVMLEKDYELEGPDGTRRLRDLFGSRSQLAVYHFMLAPEARTLCKGCSLIADHIDAARRHFEQADLAFAAVSRAPIGQIEEARKRMGWTFPWFSAHASDFNYDFGVYFTPDDRAAGRAFYNYGITPIRESADMFGASIFVRGEDGEIFHSYSTYHRGAELLIGAFNWLDLAPKGRNERDGTMSWVRLHDEY